MTVGATAPATLGVSDAVRTQSPASAPVRVMFVIYGLARAGPELRILELARRFSQPTAVHVCVIGDDLTLLDEFRQTAAKVVVIPVRRAYLEWRQLRKIVSYVGEHDIRVVNSFNLKTLLVALAIKARYGRRVTLVHHMISLWDDLRSHQRRILWAALRWVDRIVCNGYVVRDEVIGGRKVGAIVSVIPNGVDCQHFQPTPEMRTTARRQLGLTDDQFVLGTISNIRPVKNYPFLLRTMARVAARYPHVRLLCVGGGPQLEETKRLAESLGVGDKVLFTGVAADVRPFLAAMDTFVLCSHKEGNPNVVLQAMAMGVPVISATIGEVPHLIQNGVSGLLFAPGDEPAFLAAIARMAGDERLRGSVGAAGRRQVNANYSSPQMVGGYEALMRAASTDELGAADREMVTP